MAVAIAFDLGSFHLGFHERRGGRRSGAMVETVAVPALVEALKASESPETMAGGEFFCGWLL